MNLEATVASLAGFVELTHINTCDTPERWDYEVILVLFIEISVYNSILQKMSAQSTFQTGPIQVEFYWKGLSIAKQLITPWSPGWSEFDSDIFPGWKKMERLQKYIYISRISSQYYFPEIQSEP